MIPTTQEKSQEKNEKLGKSAKQIGYIIHLLKILLSLQDNLNSESKRL